MCAPPAWPRGFAIFYLQRGASNFVALLAAWARGELRTWRREQHPLFPVAIRADIASTLLATLGSVEGRDAADADADAGAVVARARRGAENPLRLLASHMLLDSIFHALLIAHMGCPPAA